MKKISLAALFFGLLFLSATAFATDIADIAWDELHIERLRSANKADVLQFVKKVQNPDVELEPTDLEIMTSDLDLEEFAWVDFAGNQRYSLVIIWGPSGSGMSHPLWIYSRAPSARLSLNTLEEENFNLGLPFESSVMHEIQDINGDGKKEAVIPKIWNDENAGWYEIYQMRNGEFVNATPEFGSFYEKAVFPKLDSEIAALKAKVASETEARTTGEELMRRYHWIKPDYENVISPGEKTAIDDSERVAWLEMVRDKMLRLLGRDPTAGLKEAREWTKSSDIVLMGYAAEVLRDIGGHEADLRRAEDAERRAGRNFNSAVHSGK